MGYLHFEIKTSQIAKKPHWPCGDVIGHERNASATILVMSDGLGSGVKANIAAQMCVSRVMELLRTGFSLRSAVERIVQTMEEARTRDLPYAVLSVARILNDGMATILTYEMPPPLYLTPRNASLLAQRVVSPDQPLLLESNCVIEPGEGVMLVSDGITQSGLGRGMANGWTAEGLSKYAADCLSHGTRLADLLAAVQTKAQANWMQPGDDCSIAMALCRKGHVLNILTGPPANPDMDHHTVRTFLQNDGMKIVCGATTAKIVARYLRKELKVEETSQSLITPPGYEIEGIDLVTEGAVTLNQVYNVLSEDPRKFEEVSGVTMLCELLQQADRVNLFVGAACNPANEDITFRQRGLINRQHIARLLSERLQTMGKLVVMRYV